jgi:hypothetical protein
LCQRVDILGGGKPADLSLELSNSHDLVLLKGRFVYEPTRQAKRGNGQHLGKRDNGQRPGLSLNIAHNGGRGNLASFCIKFTDNPPPLHFDQLPDRNPEPRHDSGQY